MVEGLYQFIHNPFGTIGTALGTALDPVLPAWLVYLILTVLGIAVVAGAIPAIVMGEIWAERRVIAKFQDRIGPNRVGPFGLLQPVADALKLLTKEDVLPARADRYLHFLAPILVLAFSLMVWAVIPWNKGMALADLNVAVLYVIAMGGVPTIGFIVAGWASYNKYSLLGGMRAAAQFISYEIPGVLAVLTPVLLAGSMSLQDIAQAQRPLWFVFYPVIGQLAFVIFLIAGVAESNRTPFDLVEAESEIIAGFHTEYSGMRFALFFLAEYANVFAISAIGATLFLGGYTMFGLEDYIPGYLFLIGKALALVFVFFWLRGTLPRLRYDQLMNFAWKGLLPVALLNVLLTGAGVSLFQAFVQPILPR
jgi:NADH-quinone oxidoreductase subunit H